VEGRVPCESGFGCLIGVEAILPISSKLCSAIPLLILPLLPHLHQALKPTSTTGIDDEEGGEELLPLLLVYFSHFNLILCYSMFRNSYPTSSNTKFFQKIIVECCERW